MSSLLLFLVLCLVILWLLLIISNTVIKKAPISLIGTRLVISIYLVSLLLSVPIFYAVASPTDSAAVTETAREISLEEYSRLLDAVYEGRLEEDKAATLNSQQSIEYNKEHLFVTGSDLQDHLVLIAVKEKVVNDGKVEVAIYSETPSPAQIAAFNPPEVRLVGDRLEIIPPQPRHVDIIYFDHDYTTSAQFTGKGLFNAGGPYLFSPRHRILYLQVPPDLKIETDNSIRHMLHYIGNK
ncbi:hypothetical protein [Desulfofalx alkaliphila]|uniref:hypothetical protein n=1 Tax=Desulfofalx alkaliphila TaxID=105483 RepID=UPI0004E1FF4E|nr:hypothetical protein [Desulfofalx alkaliphila]